MRRCTGPASSSRMTHVGHGEDFRELLSADVPLGRMRLRPRRVPESAQLTKHVLKDPAVAEVLRLLRRVDPYARRELPVVGLHGDLARQLAVVERLGEAAD